MTPKGKKELAYVLAEINKKKDKGEKVLCFSYPLQIETVTALKAIGYKVTFLGNLWDYKIEWT